MDSVNSVEEPLTYHMDLSSVRERIGDDLPRFKNVAEPERWASMVGGGSLVAVGLARRDIAGLLIAGIGAMLLHRGTSGYCPMYNKLNLNTRK